MAKKVTTIPATLDLMTARPIVSQEKRKVAGYARVSTDKDEQVGSYEAQMDYYTAYISARPDWEFVGMYSDEGISATSTAHRSGFNRMVQDALDGKIDLIIAKSVSRFARNTVDSLSTIRKLKEAGTEVFFEKENIWTFDAKGELLITIMSSLAQEESRSISENTTWGRRKSFADGKASVAYSSFLGYGEGFKVIEEEAETVRMIYGLYLRGMSIGSIGKRLEELGIPAPCGGKRWHESTLKHILTNEKYKGDALLQKTFSVDFLSKKRVPNRGEIPQYYVEGHHEAIISPEAFSQVQAEMKRRRDKPFVGSSVFSGKIVCGECGAYYGCRTWHSTDKYRSIIWQCVHKYSGEKICRTPHLYEYQAKALFTEALNRVLTEKDEVIANMEELRSAVADTKAMEAERRSLGKDLEALSQRSKDALQEDARAARGTDRYEDMAREYSDKKLRYDALEEQINDAKAAGAGIASFIRELKKMDGVITEFDESLFTTLVESMTVYSKKKAVVRFRSGMEVEVKEGLKHKRGMKLV